MMYLYNKFLFEPIFNALIFVYQYITFQDVGLAIILLTVIIRFILYPLFYKSIRNQTILQKLQPHIQKIQLDHKDSREKQAQALLDLYKKHNVNPFSGFLLLFIQLPILIALYQVFLTSFKDGSLVSLYSFITAPDNLQTVSLGLIDLRNPSILIVVLSAIAQYFQGLLSLPKTDDKNKDNPASKIAKNMVYIGPALTLLILYSLPAAVGLYWITTTVFSIVQQWMINRKLSGEFGG